MHIGNYIEKILEERMIPPADFARSIHMTPVGFRKVFKKSTIQSDLISVISQALGKNLFMDMAVMYEEKYGGDKESKKKARPKASAETPPANGVLNEAKYSVNIEIPEGKKDELLSLIFGDSNSKV